MKIGFTTDTNFFGIKNQDNYRSTTFLNEMDYYIDYMDALKLTRTQNELEYYVVDLVMEELYNQKLSAFYNSFTIFNDKYESLKYGLVGELPKINIQDVLNKEKESYKERISLLKIDYSKELFSEIIDNSLKKTPPFDSNKPNTGFKDALIWKTVIYCDSIDKCDEFYFFSGDKIFSGNKKELEKEFKSKHPNVNLYIEFLEPNGIQRQSALKLLIDKYELYETEVIKLYNNNNVVKFLSYLTYKNEDVSYYDDTRKEIRLTKILFSNFNSTDFRIDSVKKVENNYIIKGIFKTIKYNTDIEIEESKKKHLIGNIEIVLKEKKDAFDYVSGSVSCVDFDMGVIDLLRGFAINGTSAVVSQMVNIINENMKSYFETVDSTRNIQRIIDSIKPLQIQNMIDTVNNTQLESLKSIKYTKPFDNSIENRKNK